MKRLLFFLLFVRCINGSAQIKTLTTAELLTIVSTHHPLARQAALQTAVAKADVQTARGGFDPLLLLNSSRKELDGLLYYSHGQHEIKIPTWYGVDIHAGIESVNGLKVNPVETKGNSGYIGISVPLARNLLIDARRAALKQAGIFHKISFAEQTEALNNLAIDALRAYWNWWQQYATFQLFTNAMTNAQKRVELVKISYRQGERPAIDTLEALSQLQVFIQRHNEIEMELINARLQLSAFLWLNGATPYELDVDVAPDQTIQPVPAQLLTIENLISAAQTHPQLQQYQLKLESLKVDQQLKLQSLLPAVNLKYNQLTNSHNLSKAMAGSLMNNNYRYGISFSMPLRLSEGRGQYQKAGLKIEQTKLDQALKQVQIENKVKQYYNEWKQFQTQVKLQHQTIEMLQQLQRGEEQKLFNGESSLFMVNNREAKVLEARQKLIETTGKLQKATSMVIWAAGQLVQ